MDRCLLLIRFYSESWGINFSLCIYMKPYIEKFVGDGALDVPQVLCVINGASKAPPPTYSILNRMINYNLPQYLKGNR